MTPRPITTCSPACSPRTMSPGLAAWLMSVTLLAVTHIGTGSGCQPSVRAAPPRREPPDRWLVHWATSRLAQTPFTDEALPAEFDDLMALQLAHLGPLRDSRTLATLAELVGLRRVARYRPLAAGHRVAGSGHRTPDQAPTLADWLADKPRLAERLFRACDDMPDANTGLAAFAELATAMPAAVADWPELAVAFATARPTVAPRTPPHTASLVEAFAWYANPPQPLKYNLRDTPYELLRFVADSRLSIPQRQWALASYSQPGPPTKAYFDVAYDMDHLLRGVPRRNESAPYTLDNIRRLGGICYDQAYYSSEVAKALGVPATIVLGRGGSGVPHSWFAYYKISRRAAGTAVSGTWDAKTGRYQEHLYLSGLVRDPASERLMPDAVLSALGHALRLPAEQRARAEAAVELARLVISRRQANRPEPTTQDLTALAERYTARAAANAWPPARLDTPARTRPLDMALVEDLLAAALRDNLVCTHTWDLIVGLHRDGQLSSERAGRFLKTLIDRTARQFPDYSYTVLTKIAADLATPTEQLAALRTARDIYADRADLLGRLNITLGDVLRQADRPHEALDHYRTAALANVALAEIVTRAAAKAQEVYLAAGRHREAIALYQQLFAAAKQDPQAGIFRQQTSHYQLGLRLAELLDADGRPQDARLVRAQIEN